MRNKFKLSALAIAAMMCVPVMGQVTIKGIVNNNRYDDGDQLENKSKYVGYLPASLDPAGVGKAIFASKNGMYEMEVNTTKIEPVQYPNIPVSEYYSGGTFTDPEKALLVNGFNNMMGNSGALYANGELWTVYGVLPRLSVVGARRHVRGTSLGCHDRKDAQGVPALQRGQGVGVGGHGLQSH